MSVQNSIQAAKEAVEQRGRALRTLVEGAEIGRRHRASTVPVQWSKSTATALRGVVAGSSGTYAVGITLRNGSVRHIACDCRDHGRAGACKHVIALSNHWIENTGRPVWMSLRDALDALGEKKKTA
jgi:uncharacterized Zn finger protein